MGCFGVIYSVVFEVVQQYWLSETRTLTTLAQVMSDLAPNPSNANSIPDVLLNNRHYEVLIQPYPISGLKLVTMDSKQSISTYDGDFACLVTTRNITPKPSTPPKPRAPMPDWLGRLLDVALHVEPAFSPAAIDISLFTLIDNQYINHSYNVFNLGLAGDVGFAAEIGFAAQDGGGQYTQANFRAAIDEIHRIAQRARQQGPQYQTSAFSLRFVNASKAHLSMMQGQMTAMIEMDMLVGTYASKEIMFRYETAMATLKGRPHWGLEFDAINGSNNAISNLYPQWSKWQKAYSQFNKLGTFNNRFTQRMGFSNTPT
jgi:hypothetical protein